ncbi:integral membrane protein-like protein [Lentithecium fluviatile CBS 122367]|uniref:Integral membrane protein-like protein n=1 Tax=Lentithecium fluviatile CBS 122367 TaxID=1168545 RepID=A0A6G1JES2_9PLEO|nr:integral membrane protein-like protein [Lentithecium fluviatile CBS 122367]
MATPESQDAATKERIIKHMNADHSDSVRRYLEAFKKKSFYQVRNARMTDITVEDMKFDCGGQQHVIPFDPPMQSLREARDRVVQLDKEALQMLHRSDVTATRYIPPYANPGHLFSFVQCFLVYVTFFRAANFQPGSLLYDNLLSTFPRFASFCVTIQPFLFPTMIGIHALETGIMIAKLDRHGLTPFDGLWWAWVGSCFVEGVTSFWRLDGVIERRRKEKEAKKH